MSLNTTSNFLKNSHSFATAPQEVTLPYGKGILIQSFPTPKLVAFAWARDPSLPEYLLLTEEGKNGFMLFYGVNCYVTSTFLFTVILLFINVYVLTQDFHHEKDVILGQFLS